jgi:hypothetical protein
MPRRPSLSNSELQIWQVVGALGSARVRDVAQALPADRGLDFFTVQTYLRRLKAKGYLKTRRMFILRQSIRPMCCGRSPRNFFIAPSAAKPCR